MEKIRIERRGLTDPYAGITGLFIALIGCVTTAAGAESESSPAPTSDSPPVLTPTPAPPTAIPAAPTLAPPAATVTAEGCYDRGYAGRIRNRNTQDGYIYLLVEPPDDPADDARAIAETLCVLGGKFTPSGGVSTMKVNYTLKQLDSWYRLLNNQVWQVEGVWSNSVDVSENRISYGVPSALGRSRVAEIAMEAGIPADAVFAEIPPQIELNNPPANPSESGIEVSVEHAHEVVSGQAVEFSVIVTNSTDRERTITYNSAYPADIVILDPGGNEVWRHMTGVIILPDGDNLKNPMLPYVLWPGVVHVHRT